MILKIYSKDILKSALIILAQLVLISHAGATDLSWRENPPAFPEARGPGALSVGGRNGRVTYVTNLNASGPESFRAACEAQGRRIIVFKVSGIIEVKKPIVIKHPYVTIAGQTAPAGGILLKGHNLVIQTHDVILRFIRIRTGRRDDFGNQEGDCLVLTGDCHNVIVDHCSFSWSNDENVSIWQTGPVIRNITFSWNLIAEGLSYKHASCGMLIGGSGGNAGVEKLLINNNLFMSCKNRMPELKCKTVRLVNNIIYNWGWWATGIHGRVDADIVANKYVRGPSTYAWPHSDPEANYPVWLRTDRPSTATGRERNASIYFDENIWPNNNGDRGKDNWNMIVEAPVWKVIHERPDKKKYRRNSILTMYVYCPVSPVEKLDEILLSDVGASRRLDEKGNWQSNRDSVDIRLIEEYKNRKGQIPLDENKVGGFPDIPENTGCKSSAGDGVPDKWKLKYGFDPHESLANNQDTNGDGYTDIEEFLNNSNPLCK